VAMSQEVNPELGGVIGLVILLFCFWMLRGAQKKMKTHLLADSVHASGIDEQ